jgi:hypothetical protein
VGAVYADDASLNAHMAQEHRRTLQERAASRAERITV